MHLDLQTLKAGRPLRASEGQGVIDQIDWYLKTLTSCGLSTTSTGAWPLGVMVEHLRTLPEETGLSEEDAKKIRETTYLIRETLKAETHNLLVYEVTGKRFDAKALIGNVPSLLRSGTYGELPELAAFDLNEAALCVAFERPTAAAFHAVRATEGVLRQYYSSIVRTNRMAKPWLWGPMVNQLQQPRRVRKPAKSVLDHLDSIRENFRNPTQHPEKTYDIEEAQNLFGQCLSVIEGMVSDEPWETPPDAVKAVLPE